MNTDYILKVTGNILLNTKGVDAQALAGLTEESDFVKDLNLTIHQCKRVVIALSEYFYLNLTEDSFTHTNMKFWVEGIQSVGKYKRNTLVSMNINKAA